MLRLLVEQRVDAIVLATAGGCEERVRSIHQAGVPIVLVDRTVEIGDSKLDSVVESNFESAYRLTSYLLQQGHRSIGLVNGLLNVSTGKERYEGFQKALEEFGIQEDENYTFNSTFTREGGMKAVDYFLNFTEKPSAILSLNNEMAFGVLLELTRRGYSVPEDIVIASLVMWKQRQLLQAPGIISVAHKPYEMGERVGDILLKRLNNEEGPFNEIFTPRLQIDAQSVSS